MEPFDKMMENYFIKKFPIARRAIEEAKAKFIKNFDNYSAKIKINKNNSIEVIKK